MRVSSPHRPQPQLLFPAVRRHGQQLERQRTRLLMCPSGEDPTTHRVPGKLRSASRLTTPSFSAVESALHGGQGKAAGAGGWGWHCKREMRQGWAGCRGGEGSAGAVQCKAACGRQPQGGHCHGRCRPQAAPRPARAAHPLCSSLLSVTPLFSARLSSPLCSSLERSLSCSMRDRILGAGRPAWRGAGRGAARQGGGVRRPQTARRAGPGAAPAHALGHR